MKQLKISLLADGEAVILKAMVNTKYVDMMTLKDRIAVYKEDVRFDTPMEKLPTQAEIQRKSLTPMMRQYLDIKNKNPGAVLLYRMGDFYEMFNEDAKIASQVLGLTLTSRNHGGTDKTPLAGFPHHALDKYAIRLVHAGYKIAICEQVEDPKTAKVSKDPITKTGVNMRAEIYYCDLCGKEIYTDTKFGLNGISVQLLKDKDVINISNEPKYDKHVCNQCIETITFYKKHGK